MALRFLILQKFKILNFLLNLTYKDPQTIGNTTFFSS